MALLAKGASILVHEAIDMRAMEAYVRGTVTQSNTGKVEALMQQLRALHSPTEDVGRIAQEAGVKTLVLSHLSPNEPGISDESWRRAAAKYFDGSIVVAHDLMVF